MATDVEIETEIQAKGLTAPRVTPEKIESVIEAAYYFTAKEGVLGENAANPHGYAILETHKSLGLLTICVLVLRNGFTVTGESACASRENFDAGLGREIARQHAVDKIWALEGYALKERLAAG